MQAITAWWFDGQTFKQFVVVYGFEFLSVQNHAENVVEDTCKGRCLHCGPQNLVRRTQGFKTLQSVVHVGTAEAQLVAEGDTDC